MAEVKDEDAEAENQSKVYSLEARTDTDELTDTDGLIRTN